jgi:hypothetical protein
VQSCDVLGYRPTCSPLIPQDRVHDLHSRELRLRVSQVVSVGWVDGRSGNVASFVLRITDEMEVLREKTLTLFFQWAGYPFALAVFRVPQWRNESESEMGSGKVG